MDTAFDAGGKVSIGLTATTIVSQWTWSATLLQSSTVASKVNNHSTMISAVRQLKYDILAYSIVVFLIVKRYCLANAYRILSFFVSIYTKYELRTNDNNEFYIASGPLFDELNMCKKIAK